MKKILMTILLLNTSLLLSSQQEHLVSFVDEELVKVTDDSLSSGFYVDQETREEDRIIRTPEFSIDSGFYDITITYDNNISPTSYYGCNASFIVHKDGFNILTQESVPLLTSTDSPFTYRIYSPYDDASAYVEVSLDGDDILSLDTDDSTKYLLIREISIAKNTSATKSYAIKRILAYAVITIFVLLLLSLTFWKKVYKNKATPLDQ